MKRTRLFRQFVRLVAIVALLLIGAPFLSLFLAVVASDVDLDPYGRRVLPDLSATAVPVAPMGAEFELATLDGAVPVRHEPCGLTTRFEAVSGTKVTVRGYYWSCKEVWYRVELADGSQGWVPENQIDFSVH